MQAVNPSRAILPTTSNTSTYAPNHIEEVARLDENIYARDLVAEYVKAGYRAP